MVHSGGSEKSPSIPDNATVVSVRIKPLPPPTEASRPQDQIGQAATGLTANLAPGGQSASTSAHPSVAPLGQWQQPCILSGISSAVGTGVLGAFFGIVPSMLRNRQLSSWKLWIADGWKSAVALGVVSGAYTWVHCLCCRIRMKDDGWNRGIAGCSTGLILGWSGGPMSALQSCAGLGLISYLVDFAGGGEVQPAHAAMLSITHGSVAQGSACCQSCTQQVLAGGAGSCSQRGCCRHAQMTSKQDTSAAGLKEEATKEGTPFAHSCSINHAQHPGQLESIMRRSCSCVHGDSGVVARRLGRFMLAQHQQRLLAASVHQLPPVMWLGQVMAPAYFHKPAALSAC